MPFKSPTKTKVGKKKIKKPTVKAYVPPSKTGSAKKRKARIKKKKKAVNITTQVKGLFDEELANLKPLDILAGNHLPDVPSEQLIKAVCNLVKIGVHGDVACRVFGIQATTFRYWCEKAVDDMVKGIQDSIFVRFIRALDIADAMDEATDIQLVTLGVKHWQALAWKRERKSGVRWGQKIQMAIGGIEGMPIQTTIVDRAAVSTEKGAEILAILEATGTLSALRDGIVEAQTIEAEPVPGGKSPKESGEKEEAA